MPNIVRWTWRWDGFLGSPGFTNIYELDGTSPGNVAAAFDAFLYAQRARMPDDVHIRLQPEGEVIDPVTGLLQSVIAAPTPMAIDGANTGPYSAASGLCISWGTGGIVSGRRVRGRTFLVPMSGAYYDTTGTLNDTELGGTRSDLAAFLAGAPGGHVIWSRPRPAPGGIGPASPGSAHLVTSGTIRDRVAVLRSRRD